MGWAELGFSNEVMAWAPLFWVFLRGLALLDAPVPSPVFALYLLPYGSPVSDKGCNQAINQFSNEAVRCMWGA